VLQLFEMSSTPKYEEPEGNDIYGTEVAELDSYEQGDDFCDYDEMDDRDFE